MDDAGHDSIASSQPGKGGPVRPSETLIQGQPDCADEDDSGLPDEDQAAPENQEQKPKNTIDEQLNKALEILKNRESKA